MFQRRTTFDPKCRALGDLELFSECPYEDLEWVAKQCTEVELRPGWVVTREGHRGCSFVVVASGEVEVIRHGRRLGALGRRSFFGGQSLATSEPCSATITVAEPTDAFVFSRSEFRVLLKLRSTSSKVLELEAIRRSAEDELVPGLPH